MSKNWRGASMACYAGIRPRPRTPEAFFPEPKDWRTADPARQPLLLVSAAGDSQPHEYRVSDEERARAKRFANDEIRTRYLLQHHLLRCCLGHWLDVPAEYLRFGRTPFGRPFLENRALHFSISRTPQALAFYFGPVNGGVDIETLRPAQQFAPIAEAHFHPNEQAIAGDDTGFFTVWTRKEALFKALGTGLTDDLRIADCTPDEATANGRHFVLSTYLTAGCLLSLALEGSANGPLRCLDL